MKITDIRTRVFERQRDRSLRNPRFVWTARLTVLSQAWMPGL